MKNQYQQNWPLYNLSQTKEKLMFLKILNEAVDALCIPYEYVGNGRPHYCLDDMIKCCCIKVFNNFSSRRTIHELLVAYGLGHIRKVPHFNSVNNYLNDPKIIPLLNRLYKLIAMPLINFETVFAIDATGFSTFNKRKWSDIKRDVWERRDYKKLHIVCGVKTNVITSAKVTEGNAHDAPFFGDLVRETNSYFKIREICADAGYLSRENCAISEEVGATPYIFVKKNTRLRKIVTSSNITWRDMLRLWRDNEELFRQHYHKRSNVESTFSMIKRKFLPYLRTKANIAQTNEILCKVVCHNIAVLVQSIFELGVSTDFDKLMH